MLKPSTPQPLLTASPADQDVLRMCHLSHHSKQMVFHSAAPPLSTLLNTRASMWRWQEGRKGGKEQAHPHLNLRNHIKILIKAGFIATEFRKVDVTREREGAHAHTYTHNYF